MGYLIAVLRSSWIPAAAVGLMLLGAPSTARACVGDCNSNGTVSISELITGVNIALGSQPLSNCPSFDPGGNGKVDINELILGVNNALDGCTPPACSAADVRVNVFNRSGSSATVSVGGLLMDATCGSGTYPCDYTQTLSTISGACTTPGPGTPTPPTCSCSVGTCTCDTTTFPGLTVPKCTYTISSRIPGDWVHSVSVTTPSTGQKQSQRGSVVAGSTNDVTWTVFKTVKTVHPTYALGSAIASANTSAAPVLIQFNHSLFSQGIADNTIAGTAPVTISNEIVIDGTNSLGNPSPLEDFSTRVYPTIVTLNPDDPKNQANAATLKLTAKVGLVGLDVRRILGKDSDIQSATQPLVWLAGNSKGSFIRNSRIDGGAASRGNTCNGGNKTCIYADDIASTGFTQAAVVGQTEVRHCFGRGAWVNRGHLILQDNWIHHNRTGGALADSNNGKLRLARNLMEDDGKNCPGAMICSGGSACSVTSSCPSSNGCPSGQTCQLDPNYSNDPAACSTTFTATGLDEILVENTTEGSAAARLETDGDIVRNTSGHGIVLRENAEADIRNTYVCGMAEYGIEVHHDPNPPPTPYVNMNVSGSAMAFNDRGAQIYRSQDSAKPGVISFGNTSSVPIPSNPGNNAFVLNGSANSNFAYSDRQGGQERFAENGQWESCGNNSTCASESTIKNKDVNQTAGNVDIGPTQAHRDPNRTLSVLTVSPTKVTRRGAIVTIAGTGFNAIDGYAPRSPTPGTGATDCESLADGNRCASQGGLRGVCVEFKDDNNNWVPADDVLAVTPTTIVVKSSIACSKASEVRVTRQDNGSTLPASKAFCTN